MIVRLKEKSKEVETIRWTGENLNEVKEFCPHVKEEIRYLNIADLSGNPNRHSPVFIGNYILKNEDGNCFPMKEEVVGLRYILKD